MIRVPCFFRNLHRSLDGPFFCFVTRGNVRAHRKTTLLISFYIRNKTANLSGNFHRNRNWLHHNKLRDKEFTFIAAVRPGLIFTEAETESAIIIRFFLGRPRDADRDCFSRWCTGSKNACLRACAIATSPRLRGVLRPLLLCLFNGFSPPFTSGESRPAKTSSIP
jgi:hypothetical protein